MHDARVTELNERPVDPGGGCVLSWMQRSQRARSNPALETAISVANGLGVPVLAYFGLDEGYPMASERAFRFMLEGLKETAGALAERGIGFVLRREAQREGVPNIARELRAACVVADEDYLNTGRAWRRDVARNLDVRMLQVDAETVFPARLAGKEEWSAATLRRKIHRAWDEHVRPLPEERVAHRWTAPLDEPLDPLSMDPSGVARDLSADVAVPPTGRDTGGAREAGLRLRRFLEEALPRYASHSRDPGDPASSGLSPFLHFGQISALEVALAVAKADAPEECRAAFLEQVVVRRELGINFCLYNTGYDRLDGAADWARRTLDEHRSDGRPVLYSRDELENAETHDDLWNAAQRELVRHGGIHPYMRMVWAKCFLEWSPTPEEALARCLYLNDKYAMDGRDPNGYVNIAWSIYGKADRPFMERPVTGKIRPMTTAATKRKFDWRAYVRRVDGA